MGSGCISSRSLLIFLLFTRAYKVLPGYLFEKKKILAHKIITLLN